MTGEAIVAGGVFALQIVALVVALLIAASSIDDLFIDAWYWGRRIFRGLVVRRKHPPLPESALLEKPEQLIAIMAPAWQEQDVIAAMIENTVNSLNYDRYLIFVGTYPNDPETIAQVERARRRHKRVIRVETPCDGPTSKADCLNAVVAAIWALEPQVGAQFAGVVLHDAEDVVHPLELKFFNYLLPRKDLIQLPVVSLERGLREVVAGTYMDEFAEWHAKDLVARESLAKAVPSAGVGTCFSRRALQELGAHGEVFNTASLTEDYDIGARLNSLGMSSIIATFPVEFRIKRKTLFGFGRVKTTTLRMPLCVREYFPNTFKNSYRQKARWMIGIVLQGWRQLGWSRSPRVNYFLMRDRKALVAPALAIAAYVIFAAFAALYFIIGPERLQPPDRWRSLLAVLFGFNLVALVLRVVQRFYFVNRLYGWEQAVVSIPRMVVAAFVNFAATVRGVRIFVSHTVRGIPIAWDKTAHEFPSGAALVRDRRPLGAILTTWEAISTAQLDQALEEQQRRFRPLGGILRSLGWVDDEVLAEAIATQSDLPRAEVTPAAVMNHRGLLSDALCIRLRAVPIDRRADGRPVLAVARPLTPPEMSQVTAFTRRRPTERIARDSEIAASLRLLRGGPAPAPDDPAPMLLGDLLVERGHLSQGALEAAMDTYRPERGDRIGEHLLATGAITPEALAETVEIQRRPAVGSPG